MRATVRPAAKLHSWVDATAVRLAPFPYEVGDVITINGVRRRITAVEPALPLPGEPFTLTLDDA